VRVDPFGSLWLLAPSERDLVPLDDRLERARSTTFLAPRDSVVAPVAAAFLPLGGVCMHDAGGEVLRFFTASGTLTRSAPPVDSTTATADVAVDRAGYVYVADAGGQRVLVYTSVGSLVLERALGGAESRWRPAAIAVGPNDRLAVADPARSEIQIFTIERGAGP
jgi:DNA-binding beta-propeller fold protein YncE